MVWISCYGRPKGIHILVRSLFPGNREGHGSGLTINSQLKQDTVVGLAAENPERLFDAFYTTKWQGSGRGIAITGSRVYCRVL